MLWQQQPKSNISCIASTLNSTLMYAKLSVIVDNMCVHFDCRKLSHKCIRIVLFARIAYIFARSSFVIPSSKYISQTQILCGNTDLFARSKRICVLFTQFSNECSRNFCLPVTNNGCKIEETPFYVSSIDL